MSLPQRGPVAPVALKSEIRQGNSIGGESVL